MSTLADPNLDSDRSGPAPDPPTVPGQDLPSPALHRPLTATDPEADSQFLRCRGPCILETY